MVNFLKTYALPIPNDGVIIHWTFGADRFKIFCPEFCVFPALLGLIYERDPHGPGEHHTFYPVMQLTSKTTI